jgi:hypothetical protein
MYIAGLIGAALICCGYFMLEKGKWKPHDWRYLTINLVGGAGLIASLMSPFHIGNLGPIILQVIMMGISLYGFRKAARKK